MTEVEIEKADGNLYRSDSKCIHGVGHSWYRWHPTNNDTIRPGIDFRYMARCSIMGCKAVRYVENLAMVGRYSEKKV